MIKLVLTRPGDRIVGKRLARSGDQVECTPEEAAEILNSEDGHLMIRVRVVKGLLIAPTWHPAGTIVDVIPEMLAPTSPFRALLQLVPLRALVALTAAGVKRGPGDVFEVPTASEAVQLLGTGSAVWAVPSDAERPPAAAAAAAAAAPMTARKGAAR